MPRISDYPPVASPLPTATVTIDQGGVTTQTTIAAILGLSNTFGLPTLATPSGALSVVGVRTDGTAFLVPFTAFGGSGVPVIAATSHVLTRDGSAVLARDGSNLSFR